MPGGDAHRLDPPHAGRVALRFVQVQHLVDGLGQALPLAGLDGAFGHRLVGHHFLDLDRLTKNDGALAIALPGDFPEALLDGVGRFKPDEGNQPVAKRPGHAQIVRRPARPQVERHTQLFPLRFQALVGTHGLIQAEPAQDGP